MANPREESQEMPTDGLAERAEELGEIFQGPFDLGNGMIVPVRLEREVEFWQREIINYVKWYRGEIELWGCSAPTEKITTYDLKSNACLTWTASHKDEILKRLELRSESLWGKRVLDVGCGPTGYLMLFAGACRYGLDPLTNVYEKIGFPLRSHNIRYICAQAEKMPSWDGSFDAVVSWNALDHVDNFEETAREITRVLKTGGELRVEVHYHGEVDELHPQILGDRDVTENFGPYFSNLVKTKSTAAEWPEGTWIHLWTGVKR